MVKPVVAIIGRPNVGKSTLFNVLIGEKLAIIEDRPGVTRDRIYADAEWCGKTFQVIDTGGIEPESEDIILKQMRRQAELAMDMADVIVFITDVKAGITVQDEEVAAILRRTKKPVILVCNKCDNVGQPPADIYEFYNLGLGEPMPISAKAKLGMGELLDEICNHFPNDLENGEEEDRINVAIIGKPNVGKSSLVNYILGEERTIVSDIAGTYRDAIDTPFENRYGKYTFIDTAGIRKKSKVYDKIEKYSVIKAQSAVDRADVCVIMIDALEGVTEQDEKIAGYAHEKGKAMIIAINKWDLINKGETTVESYKRRMKEKFKFMSYAPVIFISTVTGQRIEKLFELINKVYKANTFRVSTSILNDVIIEALAVTPPNVEKGKRLKVYYVTQVKNKPPTFVAFVNDKELMHFSYMRYLENHIRKNFDLEGTPIVLLARGKNEKEV